jgi:hypothetical protein
MNLLFYIIGLRENLQVKNKWKELKINFPKKTLWNYGNMDFRFSRRHKYPTVIGVIPSKLVFTDLGLQAECDYSLKDV